MSTYLQLVNLAKLELGVAGDDLATVDNQTAMKKKLVQWIANADVYIQSMHWDWNFLWSQYSQGLTIGDSTPIYPSDLSVWDRDSFFLDYTTVNSRHLNEKKYIEWRRNERQGTKTNRKPYQVIIDPSGQPIIDYPPDSDYTLTADYWKTPTKMTESSDESDIPASFERVIILQTKIWFGEEQEFPLVIREAKEELYGVRPAYDGGLLRQLESHELPEQENRNMAAGPAITVVPE